MLSIKLPDFKAARDQALEKHEQRIRLARSARAAFENAEGLLFDADLLREGKRWSRAVALYVLAVEEYSKAQILAICSNEAQWDKRVARGLRKHKSKHAAVKAMQGFLKWAKPRAILQNALIQPPSFFVPDEQTLQEWTAAGTRVLEKSALDYEKLEALYVDLNLDGSVKHTPNATEADAERHSLSVREFRTVAQIAVEHVERFVRRADD